MGGVFMCVICICYVCLNMWMLGFKETFPCVSPLVHWRVYKIRWMRIFNCSNLDFGRKLKQHSSKGGKPNKEKKFSLQAIITKLGQLLFQIALCFFFNVQYWKYEKIAIWESENRLQLNWRIDIYQVTRSVH